MLSPGRTVPLEIAILNTKLASVDTPARMEAAYGAASLSTVQALVRITPQIFVPPALVMTVSLMGQTSWAKSTLSGVVKLSQRLVAHSSSQLRWILCWDA